MATETIEGPSRLIRCIVCSGRTVMTGSDTIPIGEPDEDGVRHRVANPSKFQFAAGEELDLPPDDFAYLHGAGFVRLLDADPNVLQPGSLSFPSGGAATPIGNVKPTPGLQ